MFTPMTAVVLQSSSDDGLSLAEVVDSIPLDPASIFSVLLLVAFLTFVLWAGRPKGPKRRAS